MRRVYTVLQVFEAIGLVIRVNKTYAWKGYTPLHIIHTTRVTTTTGVLTVGVLKELLNCGGYRSLKGLLKVLSAKGISLSATSLSKRVNEILIILNGLCIVACDRPESKWFGDRKRRLYNLYSIWPGQCVTADPPLLIFQ